MLFSIHRAGASSPAAGRRRASIFLSAALTPILMSLATPVAAQEASRKFGDIVLTDEADTITNDKTVDLVGDVNFGEGSDGLTNNGVITVGATATAPVKVSLLSLEALKNAGTIDLRNGHGGDVLTISGNYNGTGKARLVLDVGADGVVDRLVVGAVANGKTAIALNGLTAKTAALTGDKGPILVQAGKDSTADAFSIETAEIGFVRYGVTFDAATYAYRLKGVAGQRAYEMLKVSEGVGTAWRQSADAWSAHVANLRDADDAANGAGVWGQAYGGRVDREDDIAAAGRSVSTDYRQTTFGGQMGVDLINAGLDEGRVLLGVTGGYADSKMRFSGLAGQEAKLRVGNIGAYMAATRGGFFVNALAKIDRQSIKVRNGPDAIDTDFDGTAYGAQVEAGLRTEDDGLSFERLLSVNYVSAKLDDADVFAQRLDFDKAAGFVAKAGVRGSASSDVFDGAFTLYGAAFVAHDFTVKNGLSLVAGDVSEHLSRDGGHTFGQLAMGVSYRLGAAVAFLEGAGDYGKGREGGALRLGARIGF